MDIRAVTNRNHHILLSLMQPYEAEFSRLTKKVPGTDGRFSLDTEIDHQHEGWILYVQGRPVAFAIVGIENKKYDVSEFYVVPSFRGNGLGSSFAHAIFRKYSGEWQVRQIHGADQARHFWRKVISEITNNNFLEVREQDEYWGPVTKQLFSSADFIKALDQVG